MARKPREKSKTGIYHVMLRGIDKRNIFLDDEDKDVFMNYIFKAKELGDFQLYAYCLMDNHVHLLIKEGEELGESIKRITVGYVQKHNFKHGRTGHLFQNRYKSQVVENDNYLLPLVRYIHQNPIKAGLVKNIDKYSWSSYKDYLFSYNNEKSKIETEIIKAYFNNFKEFDKFMKEENSDKFMEFDDRKKINDEELREILRTKYKFLKISELKNEEKGLIIKEIYNENEVSIRQMERVMSINRGIIERLLKA